MSDWRIVNILAALALAGILAVSCLMAGCAGDTPADPAPSPAPDDPPAPVEHTYCEQRAHAGATRQWTYSGSTPIYVLPDESLGLDVSAGEADIEISGIKHVMYKAADAFVWIFDKTEDGGGGSWHTIHWAYWPAEKGQIGSLTEQAGTPKPPHMEQFSRHDHNFDPAITYRFHLRWDARQFEQEIFDGDNRIAVSRLNMFAPLGRLVKHFRAGQCAYPCGFYSNGGATLAVRNLCFTLR